MPHYCACASLVAMLLAAPAATASDAPAAPPSPFDQILEIACQRDEAIKQRDYLANRDCQDQYVMRFPQSGVATEKVTVLSIEGGADSKTEYTLARIVPASISLCLLIVADECVLKYDAVTHSFVSTIPWNVTVKAR